MKALVVGLGSMGKRRVRNLIALGVKEIHGFDLRADRRQEAQEKYQVITHDNYENALQKSGADVVVISLPPDLHTRFALQAAAAGKSFFTEASLIDKEMLELKKLAAEKGVVAFPSCTMRFFPGPKAVHNIVHAGKIGRPLFWQYQSGQYLPDWHPWESIKDFYVGKRETGGCREIVPFELEWLIHTFGSITEVDGRAHKLTDMGVDIDDVYMLQVKHTDGVLGQLIIDVLSRVAVRVIRVTGTEGSLEWDATRQIVRVYSTATKKWEESSLQAGTIEKQYINPEEPYIEEMGHFLRCVKEKRPSFYSIDDDMRVLSVLYAGERSSVNAQRERPL